MALKQRDYAPDARGTLAGVRALDLSRLFAGNVLTQILGDFGAEVIKVEPPAGDTLRAWRTKDIQTHWKIYSRNKKSLGLELRKPEARKLLLDLVPSAAMFLESFRPGTLEKMGLGPEDAARAQPEARHRADLRVRAGRAVQATSGIRHADRGHVGLRRDQRLRRPRAGVAPDVSRRRDRGHLRRLGGDDRAPRGRAERRARAGRRPAAARSPVRGPRPAGSQLPAHREGEAAHRQPLHQHRAAQRLPVQGREVRRPLGLDPEDVRADAARHRAAGARRRPALPHQCRPARQRRRARSGHRRVHRRAHAGRERRVLRAGRGHHRADLRRHADPRGPAHDRARARRRLSRRRDGRVPDASRRAAFLRDAGLDPDAGAAPRRAQPRAAPRDRRGRRGVRQELVAAGVACEGEPPAKEEEE